MLNMPRSGLGPKKKVWTFWIEQKTTKNMKKNIIIWMAIIKVKNFTTYSRKKEYFFSIWTWNACCCYCGVIKGLLNVKNHFVTDYLFLTKYVFLSRTQKNLEIEINFSYTLVKRNLFINCFLYQWFCLAEQSCHELFTCSNTALYV